MLIGPRDARAISHQWSRAFGDADYQSANAVATDASGNVIIAGWFSGTVNFGGGNLTAAGVDLFVAKYNSAGVHQWSKRFGDSGGPQATSVATDASGNVIVTGFFDGTVDFGGGNLACVGAADIFVVKFNSAGVHQWSKRFGNSNFQVANSVTTDASGNVIVLGNFYGSVDFGGGTLTSLGFNDVYVVKFDPSGVYQWSKRFGDSNDQLGNSVTTDASGNVVLGGWYNGTINFGGGNLTSAGVGDVYVAKLDPTGAHQWSKRFGDASDQYAYGVASDASGNVILTGAFYGTMDFGGGPLASAGSEDLFVAKFDATGAHQWSRRFGDGASQYGNSVATDGTGNVWVAGYMDGTVDFGGGPLTSGGGNDVLLVKFDPAGAHQWSQRFGNAGSQSANAVATTGSGDVAIAGNFDGAVDFGGGPLTGAGAIDIFVAQFGGGVSAVGDAPRTIGLLLSAFPNPSQSGATISFTVPSPGRVTIDVHDVRGARVASLGSEYRSAGTYTIPWDRRDARGTALSAGVYMVRVTHPAGTKTFRMVLAR